ncbi:sorting nexin-20-like [Leucoraja erinacea]|uniref:sorting nexin-20-like n=1 Tax=Leucoraja erinaceus TaxID=7782 RepID=UPI002453CFAB|nr:sorting nexin-20-like [Leucoraja erinacea]
MEDGDNDQTNRLQRLSMSDDQPAASCGNEGESVPETGSSGIRGQGCHPMDGIPSQNQANPKALCGRALPEALLTTKQLFQYWNTMNKKVKPIRLLFEIPETRTVNEQCSRYVMYKVVVIKSGTYDGNQAYIERRYSDFEKLHRNILRNFKEEVEEITFPKKIMAGNFLPGKIAERKLAFRDYLAQLYAIKDIRFSDEFIEFFYLPEVQEGYGCLRSGQYTRALKGLLNVFSLQEKLCMHRHITLVLTLSAIGLCCRDLGHIEDAYVFCEKAGLILHDFSCHQYYYPLMKIQVALGNELGRNMRHLQDRLIKMEERHGNQSNQPSLKELVVQEYIQDG